MSDDAKHNINHIITSQHNDKQQSTPINYAYITIYSKLTTAIQRTSIFMLLLILLFSDATMPIFREMLLSIY